MISRRLVPRFVITAMPFLFVLVWFPSSAMGDTIGKTAWFRDEIKQRQVLHYNVGTCANGATKYQITKSTVKWTKYGGNAYVTNARGKIGELSFNCGGDPVDKVADWTPAGGGTVSWGTTYTKSVSSWPYVTRPEFASIGSWVKADVRNYFGFLRTLCTDPYIHGSAC